MEDLTPQQRRKLEKIVKIVEDGDLAIAEHLFELEDTFQSTVNEIKSTVPDLNEVLKSVKGQQGDKGEKGDKGDEPSDERLADLIVPLIPDPKDGKDGKDGKNGKDGRDGRDGRDGVDGLDGKDGLDGRDAVPPTTEEIIKKLTEGKIPMSAVEDLDETIATLQNRTQLLNQIATQGQRGSSSTGLTLTTTGTSGAATLVGNTLNIPQYSGSGGTGYQTATGTVNGTNTVFVFSTAPSVIMVDGVVVRKTASDGTVNWTGTTTITLSVAPNFDIAGIA